jgi:hypothetical protein
LREAAKGQLVVVNAANARAEAAEARVAELEKALTECHTLSGRSGPPNEITALNEIERVSCAALSTGAGEEKR